MLLVSETDAVGIGILWAGVFGSYARNRQNAKSDVDVIVYCSGTDGSPLGEDIGEDLEPRLGRKTDCFTFQPAATRRALSFFDVETAMASQTIYGDELVVEPIRKEARRILDETIEQLEQIGAHFKEMERRWQEAAVKDLNVSPQALRPSSRLILSFQNDVPLLNDVLDLLDKACALGARGVAHPAARSSWDVFVYANLDRLVGLVGRCRSDDGTVRSSAVSDLEHFLTTKDRFPTKGLYLSVLDVGKSIRGAETTLDQRQIAESLEAGHLPPRALYRHLRR